MNPQSDTVGSYEVHEASVTIPDPEGGAGTPATAPYAAFRPSLVVVAGPGEVPGPGEVTDVEHSCVESSGSPMYAPQPGETIRIIPPVVPPAPPPVIPQVPPEELCKFVPDGGNGMDIYVRFNGRVLKYTVVVEPDRVLLGRCAEGSIPTFLNHAQHPGLT